MREVLEIDRQHQALLDLLNRLGSAIESGESLQVVDGIIDELVYHACFHFMSEERLMAEYRYPEMKTHEAKHRQLTSDVLKLKRKLRNLGGHHFIEWFQHWPLAYFEAHISLADKQLGHYISAHGASFPHSRPFGKGSRDCASRAPINA